MTNSLIVDAASWFPSAGAGRTGRIGLEHRVIDLGEKLRQMPRQAITSDYCLVGASVTFLAVGLGGMLWGGHSLEQKMVFGASSVALSVVLSRATRQLVRSTQVDATVQNRSRFCAIVAEELGILPLAP